MRLIYICGPVDAFEQHPYKRQNEVRDNLQAISDACMQVIIHRSDWLPVAPQLTFGEWLFDHRYRLPLLPDCMELLVRCDGMLVLDGWEMDAQCSKEIRKMRELNKPIFNSVSEILK